MPACLAGLVAFVAWRGAGAAACALFASDAGGRLGPAIAGTMLVAAGACALALPVGIATGVHVADPAGGRLRRALRFAVESLASVPSILLGLLGFGALLVLRRTVLPDAHAGLLLAVVCVATLVLPSIVVTTAAALEALPESLRVAGSSLGLTRWQATRSILVPAARRGILAGVVLAVGRAAEDTAVILLTGVVVDAGVPRSLTDRFEALPFEVYYLAAEHRTPADLDAAFAAALLLLVATATLAAVAACMERGLARRGESRG